MQSTNTRLGAGCGSDQELLIAKFRLKLKNMGKIIRAFRYDLNQIPYDFYLLEAPIHPHGSALSHASPIPARETLEL